MLVCFSLFFVALSMAISIATQKINGLRDVNKSMGFIQWLHLLNYDVLCSQESYIISKEECCAWCSSAGYDSIISPGSNRSRGSVILYRNSFSLKNHWSDTDGRLVSAEFAIRELSFRVLCVYAPNRFIARNDFLEGCAEVVDPGIPTFVLGDFNTVFDRSVDRRGSDPFDDARESSLALRDFFFEMLRRGYLARPSSSYTGFYVGEPGPSTCFTN